MRNPLFCLLREGDPSTDAQYDLAALSPSPLQSDAECNLGSLPLEKTRPGHQ